MFSDPLISAYNTTSAFVDSIPKKDRKKYGQFFTSRKTAEFMASLFSIDLTKPDLKLLDAGAGTGRLTSALVKRLRDSGYLGHILAVCFENDEKVLPTKHSEISIKYGHNFLESWRIHENKRYGIAVNVGCTGVCVSNVHKDTHNAVCTVPKV